MQSKLEEVIRARDADKLAAFLTENRINPDNKIFGKLTTFERVLATPQSGKLIEVCLKNGSDFFKVNSMRLSSRLRSN